MAWPVLQPDHGVQGLRDGDELRVAHELEITALGGLHLGATPQVLDDLVGNPRCGDHAVRHRIPSFRELRVDGSLEIPGDTGDHLRKLDRFRDVVDEVDEHGHVDEEQTLCDRDREMGNEIAAGESGDGTQRQDGVDEGPDEDPERDLVPDIADEVPHHPGSELL